MQQGETSAATVYAETQVTFIYWETPVDMQQGLEQLCVETQVTSICGETPVTVQQETLAAMRGNPSYICGKTPVDRQQ